MRIVSEDCTACGWAGGIETELPPSARAYVAGTRAKLDDDIWFMSDEHAAEMVALADLLELGDRWFVNPYEPDPSEES
jgi:hypothetical protein